MDRESWRILLVDDFKPWRRFVVSALGTQPEYHIVGEASEGPEAVEQAHQLQPDLILLDIGLPKLNGIEVARRIRVISPASKILFFSENRSSDFAEQAMTIGASGYVIKSSAAHELLPAVQAVLQGKQFLSPGLTGHLLLATILNVIQTTFL